MRQHGFTPHLELALAAGCLSARGARSSWTRRSAPACQGSTRRARSPASAERYSPLPKGRWRDTAPPGERRATRRCARPRAAGGRSPPSPPASRPRTRSGRAGRMARRRHPGVPLRGGHRGSARAVAAATRSQGRARSSSAPGPRIGICQGRVCGHAVEEPLPGTRPAAACSATRPPTADRSPPPSAWANSRADQGTSTRTGPTGRGPRPVPAFPLPPIRLPEARRYPIPPLRRNPVTGKTPICAA